MTTRILYTIPNLDTAGSGKALTQLIAHLDRSRFEPVVAVSRPADSSNHRRLREMDVTVEVEATTVPARPRRTLLARARRRGHSLRRLDVPIWHSFHYLDDYTEPLIARAAGALWVCQKKNMNWNRRSWRLRTGLAHAVAAQNTDMIERFFHNGRSRRVHLVPPGVTVPDDAAQTDVETVRRGFGIPVDVPLVTCVARLQPLKRQELLVRAMADVTNGHLALAGDGDQRAIDRIDHTAEDLGIADRVHRLGFVEDVDALITASTVVCLPTAAVGEGCPVALLEAMALGSAVVATDIPGSRDVVDDGVNGRLVAPDDAEALTLAIADLIADPDRRVIFGQAAQEHIARRYTIEEEASRHEAIYNELLASK